MDIKVGEYVRTRTQGIKRIDTINENRPVNRYGYEIGSEWDGKLYSTIKTTDILKHSFNIIDLIEVGDFVNYERILDITGDYILTTERNCCKARLRTEIETIVTKEQFDRERYIVGG